MRKVTNCPRPWPAHPEGTYCHLLENCTINIQIYGVHAMNWHCMFMLCTACTTIRRGPAGISVLVCVCRHAYVYVLF